MDVKNAALRHAGRDSLKRMVERVGLAGVDRRSSQSMSDALKGTPDLATPLLLSCLSAEELRAVCEERGVPTRGTRAEREAALFTPRQVPTRPERGAFVAIDFETADYGRDSACAVGLVRVEGGEITQRATHLIRPPRRQFAFTYIHGLTWHDVKDAPSFPELWPEMEPLLEGASYLVAHNAGFDRSVLRACLREAGLPEPVQPFKCSVRIARHVWGLRFAALPDVCSHLGIKLKHHEAGSDAEACARIVMAAGNAAEEFPPLKPPK